MSKKTPKKSPSVKAAAPTATRAASAKSSKTQQTKARTAKAGKTALKVATKTVSAAKPASQRAPSKPLKSAIAKPPARSTPAAVGVRAEQPPVDKSVLAKAQAAPASGLTEGAKAPAFQLPRDGGGAVSLSDYAGRNLVLFFYPRADTPGCTKEAIDFTRLSSAFAESQTAVLGVSADPPKAQEAFRDKHELATPLASDEQHQMLETYGVWGEKSMYGRTFLGVLRTTVLIGSDGRVLKIWRNVKVDGHADEVLAAVRAL
jgi:peroxiredoxin Q/BCP